MSVGLSSAPSLLALYVYLENIDKNYRKLKIAAGLFTAG
jgi:hypothetical protein